jgi:phasin
MTKVTARATKTKAATYAASPSDLPNKKAPEAINEIAETGVAHAKDTYEKATVAAEQTTDALKNIFTTVAKGAADYNLKVVEIARANTSTAFDYAHELLWVKSLPQFVELSTAHARKWFAAMTSQTEELTELAVTLTTEIAEPFKTGAAMAVNTQVARS